MYDGTLRVSIVGAGRVAGSIDDEIVQSDAWPSLKRQLPYCHAACYRQIDGVEIVSVCDTSEQRCTAFCERWGVPRYYTDYREMIAKERPDIVSVCTEAGRSTDVRSRHAEITLFAVENGARGVYCEKPMCCSLTEADAIVSGVQRHGVKYVLGAQRRHGAYFKQARRIVAAGEIGELIGVTSWITSGLLHTLSHLADTCLFLAGDEAPATVSGVLETSVKSRDHTEARRAESDASYEPTTNRWSGDPPCSTYTARLESGVFITHLPAVTDFRFEVTCADGYLRNVNNNDALYAYRRRGQSYTFDRLDIPSCEAGSMSLELAREVVGCVRTGDTPLGNEIVGRYGMEILMGVAQSHLEGGRAVELPLANRDMFIPAY